LSVPFFGGQKKKGKKSVRLFLSFGASNHRLHARPDCSLVGTATADINVRFAASQDADTQRSGQ
jgi:hypothetical protein